MSAPVVFVVRCGAVFLGIEMGTRAGCLANARRFTNPVEAEDAAETLRKRGSGSFELPWMIEAVPSEVR